MAYLLIIILFFYVASVNKRVSLLEKQLKQKNQNHGHEMTQPVRSSAQTSTEHDATFAPRMYDETPKSAYPPIQSEPGFDVIAWFKEDFMLKLGALLLLLAFGWFVSYAFANNWIGPVGRVALGLLAGVAFMMVGVLRSYKYPQQGALFAVLGSTVVVMTTYAARLMYDFFTPASSLGIMLFAVVFVAYMAVAHKNQKLAVAGLLLGAIAPLLTNAPEPSVLGLFSYLTIIVVGSIWVMALIRANVLLLISFAVTVLYSVPFMMGTLNPGDTSIAMLFGFFFTVLFYLTNTIGILREHEAEVNPIHIAVAAGVGVYLASWVQLGIPDHLQGLAYVVWAVMFATGAFVIYQSTHRTAPFYVYGAVAVGLLGAATAEFFSGPTLTIMYTLEVALLVYASAKLAMKDAVVEKVCLLFAVPLLLSAEHLVSNSWENSILHASAVVLVLLTNVLLMLGLYFISEVSEARKKIGSVLLTIGVIYLCFLVWLFTHALLLDDIATLVSLLIYTVSGIVTYVQGVTRGNKELKFAGGLLIGFVVLRLFVIDVWQLSLVGRIATFFAVGLLLISTAFITKLNDANRK